MNFQLSEVGLTSKWGRIFEKFNDFLRRRTTSLEVSNIDQYVYSKKSFIIHPRLLLNIMCKDMEGLGKTWKYSEGLGRTWKDLKELGSTWVDLKGLERTWKDLDGFEKIWKKWKKCKIWKSVRDRRLELRTSVTLTQTDRQGICPR